MYVTIDDEHELNSQKDGISVNVLPGKQCLCIGTGNCNDYTCPLVQQNRQKKNKQTGWVR
jgi:hypothetical protein